MIRGADPLAATRAAGTLLRPHARRELELLAAGAAAHAGLSLGWSAVLVRVVPRRRPVLGGAAAGLAIAALDLGLARRYWPRIAALPLAPQVADHVAFGAVVGAVVARQRPAGSRADTPVPARASARGSRAS